MNHIKVMTSQRFLHALVILIGLTAGTNALAHNVVSGAYADGMTIEGEIGLSNGDMAAAGVVVEVFNEAGEKLGESTLVEGGTFVYKADTVQKYIFKADLSAGHVAEMMIEADELSNDAVVSVSTVAVFNNASASNANVGVNTPATSSEASSKVESANVGAIAPGVSAAELQSMIRSAVAQQVRPLQKELRAYKEKVMFRDIAGGLGFIFGLFGVAAWMASKRNTKEANTTERNSELSSKDSKEA